MFAASYTPQTRNRFSSLKQNRLQFPFLDRKFSKLPVLSKTNYEYRIQ